METFVNFLTKSLNIEKEENGERVFTGFITVEVEDADHEFIAVDDLLKAFPDYMNTYPSLSDSHSNRGIGYVREYGLGNIKGHPGIMIKGVIYKGERATLYDEVWKEMQEGKRKGLSIGGRAKTQTPVFKDGKHVVMLKDLELFEIAVCEKPSNPLALIKDVNMFAKSIGREEMVKNVNGRDMIQCTSIACGIEKQTVNVMKPIRGHSWEYWEERLRRENPDYSDDQIGRIIGSWENEDKKKETDLQEEPYEERERKRTMEEIDTEKVRGKSRDYWDRKLSLRYSDPKTRERIINRMATEERKMNKSLEFMLNPVNKRLQKLL